MRKTPVRRSRASQGTAPVSTRRPKTVLSTKPGCNNNTERGVATDRQMSTDRQGSTDRDELSGKTKAGAAADDKVPSNVREFMQATLKKGILGIKAEFVEAKSFVPAGTGTADEQLAAFKKNHPERNRFKDVFCLEKTRVVLKGHSTDYIHANKVLGGSIMFICTQGPKDGTIDDFWFMMWQENATQILMLCNTEESGKPKCAQYWPKKQGEMMTLGKLMSVCKTCETTEDVDVAGNQQVVTSTIELTNEGCAPRTIYHRMWTNWPDRGAPSTAKPLMRLRQTTAKCDVGQQVVIHCSAGIGRTGTFVLMDICMGAIDHKQPIEVRKSMERVREQRLHSIQTDLQYMFVYRALVEYIAFKWKTTRTTALDKWYSDYDKAQPHKLP